MLPEGAVMMCCIGTLGKIGIAGRSLATNQQINSVVFDRSLVFPKFGYYACRLLKPAMECMAQATTLPIISKSKFQELQIPLPPLAEQKRIAAILDAADALRAKRREALAQLDALLQSTFLTLFGDPVTNSKSWKAQKLSSLQTNVQIGPFGSLLHKEDYIEGGIPLINPMHIVSGKVVVREGQTISEKKAATLEGYRLKSGDVIMGRRGEMGRCAVISEQEQGMICGTGSLFLRPDPKEFTSLFLFSLMSSEAMKRKLNELAWGVTMPNLNRTMIEGLAVPLPPLPLQQKFAVIVESIERQKSTQRAHLAELDALFAALQHRAFRGEL